MEDCLGEQILIRTSLIDFHDCFHHVFQVSTILVSNSIVGTLFLSEDIYHLFHFV